MIDFGQAGVDGFGQLATTIKKALSGRVKHNGHMIVSAPGPNGQIIFRSEE